MYGRSDYCRPTRALDLIEKFRMKKPDETYRKWHRARALNEARRTRSSHVRTARRISTARANPPWRPKVVRAWSGDGIENVLCVKGVNYPPEVICFNENGEETLRFMSTLRGKLAIQKLATGPQKKVWLSAKSKHGLPQIAFFTDYSGIRRISTAAAVVLAAEYDRARRIMGSVPPTINLDEWSDAAFTTLFEVGFFEIVGITPDTEQRYADSRSGDVRTMRMISGANSNELRDASERILELSRFIDADGPMTPEVVSALNSALGEAMINVARHAYPDDFESPFVQVKRWWIAASANRAERRLNVVVYDQGASIPWTLPKQTWAAMFHGILAKATGSLPDVSYPHDADYIEYAMGEGRTQTGQQGRGEGLPQMRDFVKICGAGSLTILSRGGKCCYRPENTFAKESLIMPIDGTLIEWEMQLPRVNE
jgi:hypothetical protein